jgi:formiminotetrahydrofolate cyclodeaminase
MEDRQKKLSEKSLEEFSARLASESPIPGGGTAAALEGALGSSLVAMTSTISAEKKVFSQRREALLGIARDAEHLRRSFLELVDMDAAAYRCIMDAKVVAPVEDAELLQKALQFGVLVPHRILREALAALSLARKLSPDYYRITASDLGLAAVSLRAAAQGAELTIRANLGSIKDQEFVVQYAGEGRAMLTKALALADAVYAEAEQKF